MGARPSGWKSLVSRQMELREFKVFRLDDKLLNTQRGLFRFPSSDNESVVLETNKLHTALCLWTSCPGDLMMSHPAAGDLTMSRPAAGDLIMSCDLQMT